MLGCAVMNLRIIWAVVGATVVVAGAVLARALFALGGDARPEAIGSAAARASTFAAIPHRATLAERLEQSDLGQSVELLRPNFEAQHSGPTPGLAAETLAVWASMRLTWDQLAPLPSTTYAKVKKDPQMEIGHRLCVNSLRVVQITADRSEGRIPVYRGLLRFTSGSMLSFVAVGSTGDLVEQSQASYCGVVTGLWEFPNVSNGLTNTVHTVGMFALPENKSGAEPVEDRKQIDR